MSDEQLVRTMDGPDAAFWEAVRNATEGRDLWLVDGKVRSLKEALDSSSSTNTSGLDTNKTSSLDEEVPARAELEQSADQTLQSAETPKNTNDVLENIPEGLSESPEESPSGGSSLNGWWDTFGGWWWEKFSNRPALWRVLMRVGRIRAFERSSAVRTFEGTAAKQKTPRSRAPSSNETTEAHSENSTTKSAGAVTTAKRGRRSLLLAPDVDQGAQRDLDLTAIAAQITRLLLAGYGKAVLESVFFVHEFSEADVGTTRTNDKNATTTVAGRARADWRQRLQFVEHVAAWVRERAGHCPWLNMAEGEHEQDSIELAVVPLRNVVRETLLERIEAGNRAEAALENASREALMLSRGGGDAAMNDS